MFPWRYNRARSYFRRPLIAYAEGDVDNVMFGHRNTLRNSYEMHGQYRSGRMKARTAEMKAALSAAKDRKGNLFEERVASYLQRWCAPTWSEPKRRGYGATTSWQLNRSSMSNGTTSSFSDSWD